MAVTAAVDKTVNAKRQEPLRISLMRHTLGLAALVFGGSIVFSFLLDLLGLPVRPWTVGLPVLGLAGLFSWHLFYQTKKGKYARGGWQTGKFLVFAFIILAFLAYCWWLGRPDQLPVGTTVDAVHQYGLADYITQSGKLPIHATDQRENLQDGLEYPPAYVTVVSLSAQLNGIDPIYLLYPVAAFFAALAAGATFAVASLVLDKKPWRLPLAGLAAGLSLVPYGYTFGSFTSQNYFEQVLAEAFLMLSLYFLLCWRQDKAFESLLLLGLSAATLVIAYPTWAAIPPAAFTLVVLFHKEIGMKDRLIYLAAVLVPLGVLAALFLKDRLAAGVGTVSNEGLVLQPDLTRYGWPVVFLAGLGLGFNLLRGRLEPRITNLFLSLLALEGFGFWLLKTAFEVGSYYSVYKLFYPAAYLVPVLAVIGLEGLLGLVACCTPAICGRRLRPPIIGSQSSLPQGTLTQIPVRLSNIAAVLSAIILFGVFFTGTWLAHPEPDRNYPVITRDTLNVARWMKANLTLDEYSVAYNVKPGTPAYWIQVGIFKMPRGVRSNYLLNLEPFTFQSWFYTPDSNRYLFTDDLSQASLDERVAVLYRSGNAAVLTRTPAYEEQSSLRSSLMVKYTAGLNSGALKLNVETSVSTEPSHWLGIGLKITAQGKDQPLFSGVLPVEKDRTRKQFLGITLNVPELEVTEFYANSSFPQPPVQAAPLETGHYIVTIFLQKDGTLLEQRKLFEFDYNKNNPAGLKNAKSSAASQFYFEGNLPETLPSIKPVTLYLNRDSYTIEGLKLPDTGHPGEVIRSESEWNSTAATNISYRLAWKWVDENGSGLPVDEALPQNGLYPTWMWPSGTPVTLQENLKLPDKAGRYRLAVALVDPGTGQKSDYVILDKFILVS